MTQLVYIANKRPVTDSLTVAESFCKEHRRVLQDIRELECSEEFRVHHFVHTPYVHPQNGQTYEKCLMTEQGFAFLAFGYTGKEAARFKEMYIGEFNRMREELNKPLQQLPQNYKEALIALVSKVEENEQLEERNLQLVSVIELDKPKVQFAETCMTSDRSILIREVAKLASKQGVMIGERRLFQKLRDWGMFVQHYNEPTQRAMEMGLFELKKGVYAHPDGARDYTTPKVTVKGQMYIINRLLKEAA